MRKPGFARISAALLISCLYTFFSCFVGTACPKEISAEALTSESEKATVTAKDENVSGEAIATSQPSATENPDSDIPMLDLSQIPDTPPAPSNEAQNGELLFDLTYSVTPDFSVVTTPIVVTTEKVTQPTTPSATTPASSSTTPQTTTAPETDISSTGSSQSGSSSSNTTTTTTTTTAPSTTPATTPAPKGWTGNLTVYNNLPSAPDYKTNVTADAFTIICRTVQAEMGERFEKEALKAQAVAAYSYIMSQSKVPVLPLSATVSDKVRQAVSEVNGMAVYYNGGYAQTVYCASSAGATANSQDIWGGYLPYLVSIDCPVDKLYDPNYGVVKTFSSSEIAGYVKTATGLQLSGNPSAWFTSIIRGSGGYITSMTIGGAGRVNGDQFRSKIMGYKIKSGNFTITYSSSTDLFTITTYGYGHGVGMSQNGANAYAKYYGYNFEQILKHYYYGVTVK